MTYLDNSIIHDRKKRKMVFVELCEVEDSLTSRVRLYTSYNESLASIVTDLENNEYQYKELEDHKKSISRIRGIVDSFQDSLQNLYNFQVSLRYFYIRYKNRCSLWKVIKTVVDLIDEINAKNRSLNLKVLELEYTNELMLKKCKNT